MTGSLSDIQLIAGQNPFITYPLVFISTIIVGNIFAFLTFWFASFGYFGRFGIIYVVLTILLADICADLLWYFSGKTLRDTKFGNFLKNKFSNMKSVRSYINEDTISLMFLAKFISSTNTPLVFLAGWAKVDFKRFIHVSLASITTWLIIILSVTYILKTGTSPLVSLALFKSIESLLIFGIIIFAVANFILGRLFRKGIGKKLSQKAVSLVNKKIGK